MRKLSKWFVTICFLSCCLTGFSQQPTISGIVVSDKDNSPLPDVTILNRQTKRTTVTDAAGRFSIEAAKGETLFFTYVGFLARTFLIENTTAATIRMTQDASQLGNVTVTTAYGIRRSKKSLGYSTQVVDGEEISQTRRENFVNSLAGRIAGATVTSSSGAPGSSSQIIPFQPPKYLDRDSTFEK